MKNKLSTVFFSFIVAFGIFLSCSTDVFAASLVPYVISGGDIQYEFTNTNAGFGTTALFDVSTHTNQIIDNFISGSANNPPGTPYRVYLASSFNGLPADTYTIFFCSGPYGGPGTDCFDQTKTYSQQEVDADGQLSVYWNGTSLSVPIIPPPCTQSCIISVVPGNYDIVATSTTFGFGVTGYVSADDLHDSTTVRIKYYNQSLAQGTVSPDVVSHYIEFPVTSSGDFTFSTTTTLTQPLGVYRMITEIRHDQFSVFGFSFWTVADAVLSTQFNLSSTTSTAYLTNWDRIQNYSEGGTGIPEDYGTPAVVDVTLCSLPFSLFGTSSTTISDFVNCLVTPNPADLAVAGGEAYTGILQVFPFGYVTRTVTILFGNESVQPPPLTYKFGSSSPEYLQDVTADDPIYFQMFSDEYFGTSSPIMRIRSDDGTNENVWDIVNPYVTFVCTIGMLLIILSDLLNFEMAVRDPNQFHPELSNSFTNAEINRALKKGQRYDNQRAMDAIEGTKGNRGSRIL